MKKVARTLAALAMVAGLCTGCGKAAKSKPKPVSAEPSKETKDKNWEPETVKEPKAHRVDDGHDHSGHNH